MTALDTKDRLMKERDIAALCGISLATVRRWRLLGQGPKYIKLGAVAVRYRPEDLVTWIESCPVLGGQRPEAR
jgi:predicted DNA-binding transcriptional regulator AlpA